MENDFLTVRRFSSFQIKRKISTDFVRASIVTPFKPPEGKSYDGVKMKQENVSGGSSDNGESSDSSEKKENREKLLADVRCPFCPIKRINVFHKPSRSNVFVWNTSN